MKADNELAISLPVYFKSVKKWKCFTKKNKNKRTKKKRRKEEKLTSLNFIFNTFFPLKFCRSTLFETGRAWFMKNWKIYSRKTSMVLTVKPISSHLQKIWPTSVSQNRREVSCSLRFPAFIYNYEENKLRFSDSKHFRFYWIKKHFISEWYFTKNHEIGSPVVGMR